MENGLELPTAGGIWVQDVDKGYRAVRVMKCSKINCGEAYITVNVLRTADLYSLNGLIVYEFQAE